MESIPKKKLCWNCDGQVTLQEELCPFCGVYLSPTFDEGVTESVQTLAPPYRIVTAETEAKFIPQSPFNLSSNSDFSGNLGRDVPKASNEEEEGAHDLSPIVDFKHILLTMVLLFAGSLFFLFSVFMLLFGYNGTFSLTWNADYWYIYLGLSVPLFFFGLRGLNFLKEED